MISNQSCNMSVDSGPSSKTMFEMAVIIDELKSVDAKKKMNSVKSLGRVAAALGQQKTRLELLPYLKELIEDSDDDILLVLAQILPE